MTYLANLISAAISGAILWFLVIPLIVHIVQIPLGI